MTKRRALQVAVGALGEVIEVHHCQNDLSELAPLLKGTVNPEQREELAVAHSDDDEDKNRLLEYCDSYCLLSEELRCLITGDDEVSLRS
jgi:hypothetical protein